MFYSALVLCDVIPLLPTISTRALCVLRSSPDALAQVVRHCILYWYPVRVMKDCGHNALNISGLTNHCFHGHPAFACGHDRPAGPVHMQHPL